MKKLFPIAALVLCFAAPVRAQEIARPFQFVSTNPIGFVLGVFSADYERQIQPQATAAISGSTFGIGAVNFYSLTGKYRYFVNGIPFDGFSVAGTAGLAGASISGYDPDDCRDFDECGGGRESAFFPTAGLELGYTWVLGANKRIIVQPTIGAKRMFVPGLGSQTFSAAIPTGGINIGYAF